MKLPTEIKSIRDIIDLAISGFNNWKKYGVVRVKEQGDLLLFNYGRLSGEWNFLERISRGLIINKVTGEVVARPFDKFFNWLEGGRRTNAGIKIILEKLDGSLGIQYRDNGHKVATRGSFCGEQALWATEFLNQNFKLSNVPNELTLLFEILYPENRIVVDYGEREDMVLLTARNRFNGNYIPFYPDLRELGTEIGAELPQVYNFNGVFDIIDETHNISAEQEGWVAEFQDGTRFKFKGDRYQELHRLLTGLTFKNILKAMEGETIGEVLEVVPEEFLEETKEWIREISEKCSILLNVTEEFYAKAPRETRKKMALWVKKTCPPQMASFVFARADGKNLLPLAYKRILAEKRAEGNGV